MRLLVKRASPADEPGLGDFAACAGVARINQAAASKPIQR
jgi:hypothetical protein